MQKYKSTIAIYRAVSNEPQRKGRTVICKICRKPYTDNISPDATEITCARCAMGLADGVEMHKKCGQISFIELIDAIQAKKLARFRSKYGFTQNELARRLGVTTRHLRRIEDSSYIPGSKVLRKMEVRLKNVRSV